MILFFYALEEGAALSDEAAVDSAFAAPSKKLLAAKGEVIEPGIIFEAELTGEQLPDAGKPAVELSPPEIKPVPLPVPIAMNAL